MLTEIEEFKQNIITKLNDDTFEVKILDNKDKIIKEYSYCNLERILLFIDQFALLELKGDKKYIEVLTYKEFIQIKTKDYGVISIDIRIKY